MTVSRRPRRNTKAMKATTEFLVEQLLEGALRPAEIAAQVGMSLAELAAWAADPANARTLEGLARLADTRAQMLLSGYRAAAAVRLIEIATDKEKGELSRKACVDLLHADLGVFGSPSTGRSNTPPPAPDERAILDALERLGEEDVP